MKAGRPKEDRVKMTVHVLPVTAKRITYLVDKTTRQHSTQGRVVDSQFGFRASDNVAGRGRRGSYGPRRAGQSEVEPR